VPPQKGGKRGEGKGFFFFFLKKIQWPPLQAAVSGQNPLSPGGEPRPPVRAATHQGDREAGQPPGVDRQVFLASGGQRRFRLRAWPKGAPIQ